MESDRTTLREAEKERERLHAMEAGREFFSEMLYGDGLADDYWKKFLQTGSISDYLKYTASNDREPGLGE